jgi:hypothetical protein
LKPILCFSQKFAKLLKFGKLPTDTCQQNKPKNKGFTDSEALTYTPVGEVGFGFIYRTPPIRIQVIAEQLY